MVIQKEILIQSSIEKAWQVLGHDFAHPYKWASAVNHSEGRGKPIESIQCNERACETSMGRLREKLTHFSDKAHRLSYELVEGLPFFVKRATNDWHLTQVSSDQTRLLITMEFDLQGLAGFIMGPMMKYKFKSMGNELVEDFAYYVENGTPHPRKLKQIK